MLADSGTNQGDLTNPFIPKAAASPARSRASDGELAGLREGLGRMDVAARGSGEMVVERTGSKENKRELDRFVPSRPPSLHHSSHSSTTLPSLALDTSDASLSLDAADASTSSLGISLGLQPAARRILSFRAPPPAASHATSHLDAQRNYLLHASGAAARGTGSAGPGAQQAGAKKRAPPYLPDRVLDAPGFVDDYYLNLIDWSVANRVAIGLGDVTYVWDAESGSVDALNDESDDTKPVTAVSWSPDGAYLAVGNDGGEVEIWDVEEGKRIRVMAGHAARVPSLSWFGHVLTSGCRDGQIHHHDVRVARHKVMELHGHTAEVCGLKWRPDGQLLASGGNDNVVNCWDGRIGQSVLQQGQDGVPRGHAKWVKRNHTAAVKALAWCPWQPNLLATGGGSQDQHIHFWSTTTGARTASLHAGSQVTALVWSPHAKELLSTHGYPDHNLSLWTYPGLAKIYDVPAHDARVLGAAVSPDGCMVATAAGDENLKFWKIWEARQTGKRADDEGGGAGRDARGQTKAVIR